MKMFILSLALLTNQYAVADIACEKTDNKYKTIDIVIDTTNPSAGMVMSGEAHGTSQNDLTYYYYYYRGLKCVRPLDAHNLVGNSCDYLEDGQTWRFSFEPSQKVPGAIHFRRHALKVPIWALSAFYRANYPDYNCRNVSKTK